MGNDYLSIIHSTLSLKMPLAQLNIARMLAPYINHPIMVDFLAQLDTINQLAE